MRVLQGSDLQGDGAESERSMLGGGGDAEGLRSAFLPDAAPAHLILTYKPRTQSLSLGRVLPAEGLQVVCIF